MSKEIIQGADRPLIGYLDERREIRLAKDVQLTVPQERPTLPCACEECKSKLVVFYELSTPHTVECPECGHNTNLMRCVGCGSQWQEGDQGFIELDVPDGSRVTDSFFDGPAYACSAKCLVDAFRYDIFDAKEQNAGAQAVERSISAAEAKKIMGWYVIRLSGILDIAHGSFMDHLYRLNEALDFIPEDGEISSKRLHEAESYADEVLNGVAMTTFHDDDLTESNRIWDESIAVSDTFGHKVRYGANWNGH